MTSINSLKVSVCNKKNEYLFTAYRNQYRRFRAVQRMNTHIYYQPHRYTPKIVMLDSARLPRPTKYPEYRTWDRTGRSHTDNMFRY